jgi:hypothetical protein
VKQALAAKARAVSSAAVAVRARSVAAETAGAVESKHPPLPLAAANTALRARDFPRAATLYLRALRAYPGLNGVVAANLLVMRHLHHRVQGGHAEAGAAVTDRRHEAVRGALERELQALCRKWASLSLEPTNDRQAAALAQAFEDAAEMVAAHPRASVAIGERGVLAEIVALLYRKLWGASVVGTAPPPTGAARVAWQRHLLNGLADSLAQALLGLPDADEWASRPSEAPPQPKAEISSAAPATLPSKVVAAASPRTARPTSPSPATPAAAQASLPAAVTARPFARPAPPRKPSGPWLAQSELQRLPPEASTALRLGGFTLARAVAAPQERGGTLHATLAAFSLLCRLPFTDSAALPPVEPRSAGCALLGLHLPGVATLALDMPSDRRLRLRMDASGMPQGAGVVVRGYQREPGPDGLVLVGEAFIEDRALAIVELGLCDGFSPILLTATTPDARLLAAALVPFPSLCPGGLHAAEALAEGAVAVDALAALSRRLLDGGLSPAAEPVELGIFAAGATGAEIVLSRGFRAWLDDSFGVRIVAADDGLLLGLGPGSQTLPLVLPADAIPSLHALMSVRARGQWPARGPYLLVDRASGRGRWRIDVDDPDVLAGRLRACASMRRPLCAPCGEELAARVSGGTKAPIALAFRDQSALPPINLLTPVAPDADPLPEFAAERREAVVVRVVAVCTTAEQGCALAETLALQEGVRVAQLTLVAPASTHASLRASLPRALAAMTRVEHGVLADIVDRSAAGGDGFLLVLGQPVLLHDARTLAVLAALARVDGVCASTCMLLAIDGTAVRSLAAGHGLTRNRDGSVGLVAVQAPQQFPSDIFPVAATGAAVSMTTAQRWLSHGAALLGAEPCAGVRLATSRISAQCVEGTLAPVGGAVSGAPVLTIEELAA